MATLNATDALSDTVAPAPPCTAALFAHIARSMRVRSEVALAPLGLRPRHFVALTLLRERGAVSQQALAGALRIDRTNLVGLLNELEDDRLIARRRVPEDRRRHIVDLTDKGARKLVAAEAAVAVAEDEVLSALTQDQRATLSDLLRQASAGQELAVTIDGE